MGRCFECCQENCYYSKCSCSCHGKVDAVSSKWTIADRYFYQAGPLPEDRYPSLDAANKRAEKVIEKAVEAIAESKGPPQSVIDSFMALPSPVLKCPCKRHRQYKAMRAPKTSCEACWRFFVKRNP